jgi:glycosyltransferase involved in cell wall biosynthesis
MSEKILYLHASAELYGSDYVLLELIRRLDRNKYQPIVLLPFQGPLVEELVAVGADVRVLGFAVLRRQYFTLRGIMEYIMCFLKSTWQIYQIIRRENVALVHTNTIVVWGGAVAARLARKPHIWQVMEIIVSPKILWKFSSLLVGVLADRVSAISDAVRNHLISGYAGNIKKVATVYHGVDSAVYHPSIDPSPVRREFGLSGDVPVVGMAARISPWKGQDCFLRSAVLVLKEIPETRFFAVGDVFPGNERYREEMLELIDELGIRDSVIVTGFRTDLPQVMSVFDVFVLPSTQPEPNATVLLGAMGLGKAVVATAAGGTLETVIDGETGFLVPPDRPDLMANAIVKLLKDPQKRRTFGEAGRARQEAVFSISGYARQIQTFYSEILEKSESRK